MKEKWQNAIIETIRDFYSKNGIKYSEHDSLSTWLSRYFSFRLRYIGQKKWNLRVSKELSQKLDGHPAKEACFDIFQKASSGGNINPYQSKGLRDADNHDRMYNDWGIHHLHLNNNKKDPNQFFYDRSDYLLFIRFTDDTAYFIDIHKHKQQHLWGMKDLIRILQTNWPTLLAEYETPGRIWTPNLDDEGVSVLRREGYTFGINVDDKSYLGLNHGYSTSGDNFYATGVGHQVIRWGHASRVLAETDFTNFKYELMEQLWLC